VPDPGPLVRSLAACPPEFIAAAFDRAFADYYIKHATSATAWLPARMQKNGVDLHCSAGAFVADELVGFTLVGVGEHRGLPAAFDAGTGIVPEHRGAGLAGRMFDFSRRRVRERGVRLFLLEVLQENEPAIRAYEKSGFRRVRSFDCYTLERQRHRPAAAASHALVIEPVDRPRVAGLAGQMDWLPSWENSIASIRRVPDELLCLGAFEGERCIGTLAYYPTLNWIMNLVVRRDRRHRGVASALLRKLWEHLGDEVKDVRMVNVDHRDTGMQRFLEQSGFTLFTRQFEMELAIDAAPLS
jgi:ribosomal protein S18 acetylase RimI-like enzyme